MAPSSIIRDEYSITEVYLPFTLEQAVEYMKRLDKYATVKRPEWYDVKTGKRVVIGYN